MGGFEAERGRGGEGSVPNLPQLVVEPHHDQSGPPRDPADRRRPTPTQRREWVSSGSIVGGLRLSVGAMGVVTIVSNDGRHAPTAAEMASVESRKTREKLRTKADHVRVD